MDEDMLLAMQLQDQFDQEASASFSSSSGSSLTSVHKSDHVLGHKPMSLVDPEWECLDPSPDVRALFIDFNDKYFWGKLAGVEVRWSPRMTLCAGLCVYQGRAGYCSVRLSEPLLKLRPRKDLIETLLHEMIHAYLFVTQNNKDHDGHGPEFQKHMHRLNKETGTNITIYHSFHDEVDNYRQHWWKCDGPCQKKPPYLGMVKRAMNRAPSPRDPWWPDHQRTCGGTYHKVKEPEGYGEKKKNKHEKEAKPVAKQNGTRDIRSLFGNPAKGNKPSTSASGKPTESTRTADSFPELPKLDGIIGSNSSSTNSSKSNGTSGISRANVHTINGPAATNTKHFDTRNDKMADSRKANIHTFNDYSESENENEPGPRVETLDNKSTSSKPSHFPGKGKTIDSNPRPVDVSQRRIPGLFEPTKAQETSKNPVENGMNGKMTNVESHDNKHDFSSSDDEFDDYLSNLKDMKGQKRSIDKSDTPDLDRDRPGSFKLKDRPSVCNPVHRKRTLNNHDSTADNELENKRFKFSEEKRKSWSQKNDNLLKRTGMEVFIDSDSEDEAIRKSDKEPISVGNTAKDPASLTHGATSCSSNATATGKSFTPQSSSNLNVAGATGSIATNSGKADLCVCPVCSIEIEQSGINNHLDQCLQSC